MGIKAEKLPLNPLLELIELVEEERNSKPSNKNKNKIEELKIIEFLESLCDPGKDNGEWLRRQDIVESKQGKKRYLSLDEPGGHIFLHSRKQTEIDLAINKQE